MNTQITDFGFIHTTLFSLSLALFGLANFDLCYVEFYLFLCKLPTYIQNLLLEYTSCAPRFHCQQTELPHLDLCFRKLEFLFPFSCKFVFRMTTHCKRTKNTIGTLN